ncbi:thiamine-phosphate kinase [Ruania albidiflava]|uniref:thiamine-phosphate kinase n=1 Tax=Ruania albidiflava TaxID=366586 RepID=UPI0003B3EC52|nr:thiamine-phosphate kinase [Ruania albidiflava]
MRISDVSEEDLLAQITPLLPLGPATLVGPGDDAAVVSAADGTFVVTTDVLVAGRHFSEDWTSGADVGWRAVAANVADVAAMGALPTALVTSLVLPASTAVDWVLDLATGLGEACTHWRAGAVGGDLSSGDVLTVAVTAHGDLQGRAPVLRSTACPGEVLAHAGVLGRSAAGWALLAAGQQATAVSGAAAALQAFRRPQPPVAAGARAADAGATAMMDVSDGLLRDSGRMARASGVHLDLDPAAFGSATAELADLAKLCAADPLTWVLTGGEDHGLLATFPAGTALPEPFRAIGSVGAGAAQVTYGGEAPSVPGTGWDHFSP